LLEVLDGVGEQAGGEDHQQTPDNREEPRQVQLVA
jgi:hypothetical protein